MNSKQPLDKPLARIKIWLNRNAPEALSKMHRACSEKTILDLENSIQKKLPEDFRLWLQIHNGGEEGGILPDELLSASMMAQAWITLKGVHSMPFHFSPSSGEVVASQIKPYLWLPGWIPISSDAAGNPMCLDLDPTNEGQYGQVIRHYKSYTPEFLAESFNDFLTNYANDLEAGKIAVLLWDDDKYYKLKRREEIEADDTGWNVRVTDTD